MKYRTVGPLTSTNAMRYFFLNRLLRFVQTQVVGIMRCTMRYVVGIVAAGIVILVTLSIAFVGSNTDSFHPAYYSQPKKLSADNSRLSPWQRHINKQCQRHNRPTSLDRIDPKMLKHFIVDEKYKLIYCQIPKVATTTWRRIFIVLTGKVGTTDIMTLSSNDVHHKHDEHLKYLSDLPEEEIKHRLRTYFKFVFVREPFERILSAFRNKFDGPYKPTNYFQDVFGRKIIKRYRAKNHGADPKEGEKVKFPEFVDYLVDQNSKIPTNEHWEQFYKLCLPCAVDYDFIGKLESIQEDSNFLLEKSGIKSIIKFPSREESRYKTKQTNTFLRQYYSQVSKSKLGQLWSAYKMDFDIFNYTMPKDVKDLMYS